ncbi:MAG TPA: hypothetical protein ENI20_07440 [Bacteroides sp.]|nr:hypothetical protein [Bacteroides sp.]
MAECGDAENYFIPDELRAALVSFVHYYNNERYHESLENMTPADVYFGRAQQIKCKKYLVSLKVNLSRSI